MAATITLNSTFAHLNDDRTSSVKQNSASRERSVVCDILVGEFDTYVTNGIILDFSKIRRFSQVYVCEVAHKSYGLAVQFVPAVENDAATGKLKFFDDTGVELTNGSAVIQGVTLRVIIRGI